MTTATTICQKAAELVKGDRHDQYGPMKENLGNIATLWTAYLGVSISAEQVAWLNILQKCARTKTGSHNLDNYVDAAGYAGIAGEVHISTKSEASAQALYDSRGRPFPPPLNILKRVGIGEAVKTAIGAASVGND